MLVYMTSMVRVRAWKVHGWASPQLGKGQIPGGALRCPPGVRCRLLGNGKVLVTVMMMILMKMIMTKVHSWGS